MSDIAKDSCWLPVLACFFLSGLFVGSLYVWHSKHDRNHPSTIKQRLAGLIPAAVLPLLLTMVLFLGPLCEKFNTDLWKSFVNLDFWMDNVRNLIWLRNIIVGPLAEEFTFRACMVPLLLQCLKPSATIFVCCLFFGLAHIHHIVERYQAGDPVRIIYLSAIIQFSYTTVFGAYSTFVFLQTGHFVAPFIIHAFCNVMGFPDFGIIFTYKHPKKSILIFLHILGVVLWYLLLLPLLNHTWYENYVYFIEVKHSGDSV